MTPPPSAYTTLYKFLLTLIAVLQTLVTHPKHERRGAGSLLLKWGCEEADRKGVEAYLEASAVGVPLYERHGFKKVKDITLDLKDFGGNQKFTFTVSLHIHV